jgi:dihydroorotate dehydrogenase electron transfer subunit
VLGPLGKGFTPPDRSVEALILAGGIGIASVHFLLVHLMRGEGTPPTVLYGVRSPEELVPLDHLEKRGLLLHIATEDGKKGVKGTVSDLLSTALEQGKGLPRTGTEAFVCGPLPMLKALASRLTTLGIKSQFSLESRMACGYGVCQGCVIPFKDEKEPENILYRKVCTDGPVFPAEDICWKAIR